MSGRTYLDHAAATPLLPAAREAMIDAMARWANASSPHAEGRAARSALEAARGRIKDALGWRHELIFTSGASEAAALALGRATSRSHAIASVEHDAVKRSAVDPTLIPVNAAGIVDLDHIPQQALVAIQTVNSETGVIQPADRIVATVRERGSVWVADAAQSAGKLPLPDADMIIISSHKLGGPPGIGALLIKDLSKLSPNGGQEKGYRAGTENLPAAMGFAAALSGRADRTPLGSLRRRLDEGVIRAGGVVVAADTPRLPEIASYRLPGVAAAAQLITLDLAGIAVSAGSACSSGTLKASPVLLAMGWSEESAREVIRVSLAPETTEADIMLFLDIWSSMANGRRTA